MKTVKRFFATLLACVSVTALAVGFSACEETTNAGQNNSESSSSSNGGNGDADIGDTNSGGGSGGDSAHICSYVCDVVKEEYFYSAATCTARAKYYYCCECGAKGTNTFEYGDMLAHTYDQTAAEDTYLKDVATCTSKAV